MLQKMGKKMSKNSKIIYFFITAIFFIIIDVYFSEFIIKNGYKLAENSFFSLTFIQNEGAAFSLFEGLKAFLITFSALSILFIIFYTIKQILKISSLGLFFVSLLTAGIFCNMAERICFGYVRDYIKLNFIDFPVFNISDIFINIAVCALILIIIKNNLYKNKSF